MHVAEVLESGLFVVGHAAREIRIGETLIARRFRHVLQDAELLLDHLLAVPGHLAHLGQHIVFDVVALRRSQLAPGIFALTEFVLLRGRHAVPLIELLTNFGLLVGRKILERFAALQNAFAIRGRQRAHGIHPRPWRTDTELLALVQLGSAAVIAGMIGAVEIRLRIRRPALIGMADVCLGMVSVSLRMIGVRIMRRGMRLRLVRRGNTRRRSRGAIGILFLRKQTPRQKGETEHRQQHCAELESVFQHRSCSSSHIIQQTLSKQVRTYICCGAGELSSSSA